jgi:hypothetical protein
MAGVRAAGSLNVVAVSHDWTKPCLLDEAVHVADAAVIGRFLARRRRHPRADPGLKNLTDHFLEEWFWLPRRLDVGPIAQTLDAAGAPSGAMGKALEQALPRFADDMAERATMTKASGSRIFDARVRRSPARYSNILAASPIARNGGIACPSGTPWPRDCFTEMSDVLEFRTRPDPGRHTEI